MSKGHIESALSPLTEKNVFKCQVKLFEISLSDPREILIMDCDIELPERDADGFCIPLPPKDKPTSFFTLDSLPPELFLHVCSFLKAKFVIKTLSQVCKNFRSLIQDDTFWKVRMRKRCKKRYPAIPGKL